VTLKKKTSRKGTKMYNTYNFSPLPSSLKIKKHFT